MKKAVHFGAGSIGLGFIGERLHVSGYQITFVDVNDIIVQQLQQDGFYELRLINHSLKPCKIEQVSALSSIRQRDEVIALLSDCDLVTTSVWPENLPKIAKLLAEGLERRFQKKNKAVNILACENAMFASNMLKEFVIKETLLSQQELGCVGYFVNTAIARMVLDSEIYGKKTVDIADDYEIVIARNDLVEDNQVPIIGGEYTNELLKFIERKLFIVNSAHCIGAYYGYLAKKKYIRECFEDKKICFDVVQAMSEAAELIHLKHHFEQDELKAFIDKTIKRYTTPDVCDDIVRVCRTPLKKVSKNDRLLLPILECKKNKLPYDFLCKGVAAAYCYDNEQDQQAMVLQTSIAQIGIEETVRKYSSIIDQEILDRIILHYQTLKGDRL